MASRTALVPVIAVLSFALADASRATTVELQPLDHMAAEAQTIAHVKVVSAQAAYEQDRRIWTTYVLQVVEGIKPPLPAGTRLTIKQVGGTVGDQTLEAVGFPQFQPGDEAVLFLKDFGAGWPSVMNAWQGCVRVTPAAPAVPGREAVAARVPDAPALFAETGTTDLAAFVAAVRGSLARSARAEKP